MNMVLQDTSELSVASDGVEGESVCCYRISSFMKVDSCRQQSPHHTLFVQSDTLRSAAC